MRKRNPPRCARKIVAVLRLFVIEISPMVLSCDLLSIRGARTTYIIRLRKSRTKNEIRSAGAPRFGSARRRKVAQTDWIETIEYKSLTEWRTGGEVRGFANKRGLPFEVSRVIPQQEGEGLGQRNHDEFRAAPAANAHAPGPDSVRRHRDSTGGADVRLRRAERTGKRPRGDSDPDRNGGDAVYGHQLRTNGARVSERGFCIHVRCAGDSSSGGICHRLEHGHGLHAQSVDLHGLVRAASA